MLWTISGLFLLLSLFLLLEAGEVRRARSGLCHVIHVNGTRGKSSVSRLIDAGLRQGGWRVFCKTTGTVPVTIDVNGAESPLRRRGGANIKEQIGILRRAYRQKAQVLVAECMALQPELQWVSQHRILRADIAVITNVRRDHTDVMGESLEEICDALSNTIPPGGILVTGEARLASRLEDRCRQLDCRFIAAYPGEGEPGPDFPENVAVALAVCARLGVERETALRGMMRYRPDPYALSVYRMGDDLLINGMAINDIESTVLAYERLRPSLPGADEADGEGAGGERGAETDREGAGRPLVLLINNRPDRGSRTQDMPELCRRLEPSEVWLTGAAAGYMAFSLRRLLPQVPVRFFSRAGDIPFSGGRSRIIYAAGNIAGEGKALMARAEREGRRIV